MQISNLAISPFRYSPPLWKLTFPALYPPSFLGVTTPWLGRNIIYLVLEHLSYCGWLCNYPYQFTPCSPPATFFELQIIFGRFPLLIQGAPFVFFCAFLVWHCLANLMRGAVDIFGQFFPPTSLCLLLLGLVVCYAALVFTLLLLVGIHSLPNCQKNVPSLLLLLSSPL